MEECALCGRIGGLEGIRHCSVCKYAGYCSRQCQKQHWPLHKLLCKQAKERARDLLLEGETPATGGGEGGGEQQTPGGEALGGAAAGEGGGEGARAGERKAMVGEGLWSAMASAGDVRSGDKEGGSSVDGDVLTCQKCGIQRFEMKTCGSCKKAVYCSRDCQRADWKMHKLICQPAEALMTTADSSQSPKKEPTKRETKKTTGASPKEQQPSATTASSRAPVSSLLAWEEARSRARKLYPRRRIVDKFRMLGSDWMGQFTMEAVVALVRIQGIYPHFFRYGRCLEDAEGKMSFVIFHTENPRPYFSYEQLQEGNFLCYDNAQMHFFMDGTVGFRIDVAADVHILEPTKQTTNPKPATTTTHPSSSSPSSTSTPLATPQQWTEAKSKTQAACAKRDRAVGVVVDVLQDVDQSALETFVSVLPISPPTWQDGERHSYQQGQIRETLLVLLQTPVSHSWRHGWVVQDRKGKSAQLNFELSTLPQPYFSFQDLQKGVFLSISQPHVVIDMEFFSFVIKDASRVQIIRL